MGGQYLYGTNSCRSCGSGKYQSSLKHRSRSCATCPTGSCGAGKYRSACGGKLAGMCNACPTGCTKEILEQDLVQLVVPVTLENIDPHAVANCLACAMHVLQESTKEMLEQDLVQLVVPVVLENIDLHAVAN